MVKKLTSLWHHEHSLHSAAGLLVITMLLSNVLGFARDVILANNIPLHILDTYYAAFRIPDFLFNLFILGAISSAFIPVFLDIKHKEGEPKSWELANTLISWALIILAVVGALLYWFMPTLLQFFVPGFSHTTLVGMDPGYLVSPYDLTVTLARILLLSPFCFAVSYIFGGMLNAYKKFFAYALAPIVYNVAIILGGLFGHVIVVAWLVVIGALFHAFVQVPSLRKTGYRFRFNLTGNREALGRVIKLMIPRSISLGMAQLVLLFFTRIGSTLPAGAVSIYTLTNNVQTTPVAIFAASIATAVFPMLGERASKSDDAGFTVLITQALKGMLYFIIPSMGLLWVLRAHIIRLYLALNHQTWEDTIRAIDTFGWFILALASQGIVLLVIRAFYARHDTARPMYISLVCGALSVLLAYVFVNRIGDVPALSLAFATASIVEALVLLVVFQLVHQCLIDLVAVLKTFVVAGIFAVFAGLAARVTLSIVSEGVLLPAAGLGTDRVWPLFLALVAAGMVGLVVYAALSVLTRREELLWLSPKRAAAALPLPESESLAAQEGLGNV